MKNKVLLLGEKIFLPAANQNNKLVAYTVISKEKGGVYHLVAESYFVQPRYRTITRAKSASSMGKAA